MRAPLVSVLLATRDDRPTLPRALEPLLASGPATEIVVVDDGSGDGTRDYLSSLGDRVVAIRLEESVGLTRALNLAAARARGAFLARQDADDASHPDRLGRQLERFRAAPDLQILGTGHRIVDEAGAVIARLEGRTFGNPRKRLLRDNVFCHGSLMFRAEAFRRLGGYREFFRFSQDYDLLLRAASLGMRMENLRECLYDWTFTPRSISGSKAREQALYAQAARLSSLDPTLDPAECYRRLDAAGRARPGAELPPERRLLDILLRAGDTDAARGLYRRLRERGAAGPDGRRLALLTSLPPWAYRSLRALADLRYR